MQNSYNKTVKELKHYLDTPNATNFSAKLFQLIAKADFENLEKIRLGFPDEVKAYEDFMFSENAENFFQITPQNKEN